MSSRIDEIRAAHRMETDTDTDAEGRAVIVAFCAEDDADWPCDIAHLLAELARVTSERDATLRRQYDELQADNGRLLGRIKSLENDLEHALASVGAFRAALAAYADLIDYKPFMEFERAFNPTIDNESAPYEPDERERWLIRQAWVAAMNVAYAALAGSREQATPEGE